MSAAEQLTVDGALAQARAAGIERFDAVLLLSTLVQQPRSWLITHDDAALSDAQCTTWAHWLAQRAAGVPVAYLLGEQGFHGLTLRVQPGVLVPRPDTELLVDWALETLAERGTLAVRALDLGTGSGAIALAVKHRAPDVQMTAVDTSADALAVARANGERLGLAVTWQHGHWWQAVPGQRFDLVLSNPPYIADGDPHLPALRHEPTLALTSGPDGLDALREIIAGAAAHMAPSAWLLLEHGFDQHEAVQSLLRVAGFHEVSTRWDLGGNPRCTGGRAPAA